MVSIGLPPPVAVFASPVPEPSIRCHQGHEGSRWRGDVVGNAWGEGGADRGQGKVRGGGGPGGCDLELQAKLANSAQLDGYHEARTRHATWRMRTMAVVYRLDSQLGARRWWGGVNTVRLG